MNDTRWLDERQEHAWRSLLSMHARLMARLNRQLQADSGLSLADFEVLVRLTDDSEGRVRIGELACALRWEKSRLSHQLGRMGRRGLVERQECDADARGVFIVVTPQGRRAIEQAAPGHVDLVREMVFDELDDEEVETLARVSRRVMARLDADAPAPD